MIRFLKDEIELFTSTFRGSETILWARLQYVIFALYTAMQALDMSLFISDKKLFQGYLLMNGFIGEMARRHREDWQEPK